MPSWPITRIRTWIFTKPANAPLDYSYGWFVDNVMGHARQMHGGRYRTGFRSMIERFPDDDLSVIVLTNCDCGAAKPC